MKKVNRVVQEVADAIKKRHDDGSSFEKEWTNHHGLLRCDCDELYQFIMELELPEENGQFIKSITTKFENAIEMMIPPVDTREEAIYETLTWAMRVVHGEDQVREIPTTERIKTEVGRELIKYINQNYGPVAGGKVLESLKAIEKELL